MAVRISEEALRALELDPATVGEADRVSWPEGAVGRDGAVRMTVAAIIASQYQGVQFADAPLRFAPAPGVRVQYAAENPRLLRVLMPPGVRPEVRAAGEEGQAWALDADAVVLDTGRTGPVLVMGPGGVGVAIEPGPVYTDFAPVYRQRLEVPPLVRIESPVGEWTATRAEAWLQEEIRGRLAEGGPWQQAVAVGLFARLGWPREPARVVEMTLRGKPVPELAAPRRWARGLSPDQVRTIRALAAVEIDRLHQVADDLARSMACDDPGWRADLLHLCHDREDLEGVRLLLAEAGAGEDLMAALDLLDSAGQDLMLGLPVRLREDDERLRRASELDPEAWWVVPAVEPLTPDDLAEWA